MSNIKDMTILSALRELGLNGKQLKIVLASLNFDVNKPVKKMTQENIENLFAIDKINIDEIGIDDIDVEIDLD